MYKQRLLVAVIMMSSVIACSPGDTDAPEQATIAPAPATVAVPSAASGSSVSPSGANIADAIPGMIVAERGGFIPEGIEYDLANGRFLTGSLAEGTIFEIGLDGSVTPFIRDAALVSTVGIEVDEPRDRLLVANSDSSVFQGAGSGQAKLGVYSLTTGERFAMVDLAAVLNAGADAVFFANDVAVADDGTAFVTDTRQNVVYRVTPNYAASVLFAFPATEGLSLNGIVYHPDGYLLVADSGNGAIYKMPIANPAATASVRLPEPMSGADGIVWRADGALAVIQNSAEDGRVAALVSTDNWGSAQIAGVAPHDGQATTGAAVGNDIFAVQPHFNDQDPPSIHRAVFR
jgi:sugar lactone lactonase YvrE